ncbi:hypothetical protein N2152v2_010810 [Parachlorella kessleri]
MSDGRKAVQDIWKELQSATAPKGRLGGLGNISYSVQRQAPRRPKGPGFIEGLQPRPQPAQPSQPGDTLLASLQRNINCLSDADRRQRVRALESISGKLLGSSASPASTQLLAEALSGPLLVPLVRLLADPAEKCREQAATFLQAALGRPIDISSLLPVLVPALAERMGSLPVEEPSEEMRLLLAQLAAGLAQHHAAAVCGAGLLGGLIQVVCRALEDSYPDIKKVGCTAVATLAVGSGCRSEALEPQLDPLLSSLLPLLQHQHSRVRLAALEALHALVMRGLRYEALQEQVAPAVRPLVHDHAGSVRAALFASAARWMGAPHQQQAGACTPPIETDGRLANQCRSSVPLLLPTLLLGLTDELPAIRSEGLLQVQGVATAYRAMQARAQQDLENERVEMEVDEEGWSGKGVGPGSLPGYSHPFQASLETRPSYAARRMVVSELPRLMPHVFKGSAEWTITLRAEATRLLHVLLIFAEAGALQYLPAVLQALRSALADDDSSVAARALAAAHVLGVNLPAKHWAPFVAEALTAEQLSTAQRATALCVFDALLFAAGAAQQPAEQATVQLLATALGHRELLQSQLHLELLAALRSLVLWGRQQCSCVAGDLLLLLLTVDAAERGRAPAGGAAGNLTARAAAAPGAGSASLYNTAPAAAKLTAAGVVAELATSCGLGSAQQLCDQLAPRLLPALCQDHDQWQSSSPSWQACGSLLRCCGPAGIVSQAPLILAVLRPLGAGHDRDPELRWEALELVDHLLQDPSKADAWQGGLGGALAEQVLLPALAWRAGQPAAVARFAALAALATMLDKGRLPGSAWLELARCGDMMRLLYQCLEEDYMSDTRMTACTALQHLLGSVGPSLSAEELRRALQELKKRLDDSSNAIRIAACATLATYLSYCLPAAQLDSSGIAQLASSLLLHMDDPDPAVQEAACAVLVVVAQAAPAIVKELASSAARVHRSRAFLDRVLSACDCCS